VKEIYKNLFALTHSVSRPPFWCVFFIGGTPLDDAPLVFLVYICAEGTGAMEVPLTCLPALPRIAFAVIVGVLIISRPDVDVDGMFNDVLGSSGEVQGDGDAGGPTG